MTDVGKKGEGALAVFVVGSEAVPIHSIWLAPKSAQICAKGLGDGYKVTPWPISYGPFR